MKAIIVGGKGHMGVLTKKILERHGITVFPVGRETKNVTRLLRNADVVFFSVPATRLEESLKILPRRRLKKKLLVDLSWLVAENAKILKSLSPHTAFIHFLFGPDVTFLQKQRIVVAEDITDKRFTRLTTILKEEGALLTAASPNRHDYLMALVQALSQFSSIALGKTLSESRTTKKELDDFASITFSLNAAAISRIATQKPELWAALQFNNRFFEQILQQHLKNISTLAGYAKQKDFSSFAAAFERLADFWSEESQNIFVEKEVRRSAPKKAMGVLGPQGSYSHEASTILSSDFKPLFFESIPEVIEAVARGKISRALLPFENSLQGTVLETLDGLYYHNLKIRGEIVLSIRHAIAGFRKPNSPKAIRRIFSHPQALGQCARYLKMHYPHAKLVFTPSTSSAFQKIKEEEIDDALAVGSEWAAKINGLAVIHKNIQDSKNNQTLFVVIAKKSLQARPLPYTLLTIDPKSDRPGILHDMLAVFKTKKINLLKLESRPSRAKLGAYLFYLKAALPERNKKTKEALRELRRFGRVAILTN